MLEIRTGTPGDVNALAAVEKECFPPAEAATKEILQKRLACYGNHFWLLMKDGKLISFVDGMVTDEPDLKDEMYEKAEMHKESGQWQMIFGVNTKKTGICGKSTAPCHRRCKSTGKKRACFDLQKSTDTVLRQIRI